MSAWSKVVYTTALLSIFLLTGCAISSTVGSASQSEVSLWRGRLAVRIESGPAQVETQSFSAEFELSGNPQTGQLTLYTPLGTTAAALSWTVNNAILQANRESRHFDSLDTMMKETLGTEIPVAALFAWLAGDNMTAAGWRADLSQYATGQITAQRSVPAPSAQLRLVLER